MMRSNAWATTLVATVAFIGVTAGSAMADLSKKVQTTFRGQLLITAQALPGAGETDEETIKLFKKVQAKTLVGSAEEVPEWTFHFTAFLKQPTKVDTLSLDFYTNDKEKLYVANKRLMGVTTGVPILSGQIAITEDDGLLKGKSYIVKLSGKHGGKEFIYAETTVATK